MKSAELVLIPHGPDHLKKLDGVNIVHALGCWVIAKPLMISRQAKHVLDADSSSPQKITLKGKAISISDHHLKDRFHSQLL
jgi:hypothetical protein